MADHRTDTVTDAVPHATLVHVRFAPDGSVTEISERPAALSPQGWFDWLSLHAGDTYRALAGGRGVFRLDADKVPAMREEAIET
ncbi:hypothetical protein [Acuticoccus sediminis]|uniref:hypothetical protein n=1 Tax=Acuticoccus sediminis TaxID=2184697 RepID=UPI001CFE4D14|nr:hypothetical protein [Acuticoccus sediminis]